MSYQRFYCKVLESNLLIQNSQHGFRKGRSCSTNLLEFLDKVSGCVDSGDNVDIVFLDFAKAFDKVSYWKLLLKLQAHGIEGKLLDWITQWLKNIVQRVRIRGIESDWLLVLIIYTDLGLLIFTATSVSWCMVPLSHSPSNSVYIRR